MLYFLWPLYAQAESTPADPPRRYPAACPSGGGYYLLTLADVECVSCGHTGGEGGREHFPDCPRLKPAPSLFPRLHR